LVLLVHKVLPDQMELTELMEPTVQLVHKALPVLPDQMELTELMEPMAHKVLLVLQVLKVLPVLPEVLLVLPDLLVQMEVTAQLVHKVLPDLLVHKVLLVQLVLKDLPDLLAQLDQTEALFTVDQSHLFLQSEQQATSTLILLLDVCLVLRLLAAGEQESLLLVHQELLAQPFSAAKVLQLWLLAKSEISTSIQIR
jgi:hypothetical protein